MVLLEFLLFILIVLSIIVLFMGIFSNTFFVQRKEIGKQGDRGDEGSCLSDDIKNNTTYNIINLDYCAFGDAITYIIPSSDNNTIFNSTIPPISSIEIPSIYFLIEELKNNIVYELYLNINIISIYYIYFGFYCTNQSGCTIDNTTIQNCQIENTPIMTFYDGDFSKQFTFNVSKSTFILFRFTVLNQNKIFIEYKTL